MARQNVKLLGHVGQRQMQTGDFMGPDGSSLAFEAFRLTTTYAVKIVNRLQENEVYRHLRSFIKGDVLDAYYVKYVWNKIAPAVAEYAVTEYGSHRGIGSWSRTIRIKDGLLYPLFSDVWDQRDYLVVRSGGFEVEAFKFRLRQLRNLLRKVAVSDGIGSRYNYTEDIPSRIGVEALEGINLSRRSDLFWFDGREVDPRRLLVYFLCPHKSLEPIKRTASGLDRLGIPWVSLRWGVTDHRLLPWSPGFVPSWTKAHFLRLVNSCDVHEPWNAFVIRVALDLLSEVDYWRAFFQAYRIKICFSVSPVLRARMAQRIALDLDGGVQVGSQRSFILKTSDTHAMYPQHVFFTWGDVGNAFDLGSYNCDKHVVVSGFVYDGAFQAQKARTERIREQLGSRGVKFTISLLDNAITGNINTRIQLVRFYQPFLKWLVETDDAGLVIKPKWPKDLERLYEIRELLQQAKRTGRCIELPDAVGRLPSDASSCGDLTVGFFISSAAIEAAIGGYRAVHCDLSKLHYHPFYEWGYEKIVFDDLDRLMAAIRRYKDNPNSEPALGDHSPVIEQLDPYRDGQAGERVGRYLHWLLEAFDKGQGRDSTIREVNVRYTSKWGLNKILYLQDGQTPTPVVNGLQASGGPRVSDSTERLS